MSRRHYETAAYALPEPAVPLCAPQLSSPACLYDPVPVLDEAALIAACRRVERRATQASLAVAGLALGGFAVPTILRALAALV